MSQDKPVLSREQVEDYRTELLSSVAYTPLMTSEINALCDLALSALSGWISVEERLPDPKAGQFLVTNNLSARDANGNMSHIWLRRMLHDGGEELGWFAFDDYAHQAPQNVTHWMPLPPAPHASAQINEPPQEKT